VQDDLRAQVLSVDAHDQPMCVPLNQLHVGAEHELRARPPKALREFVGQVAVKYRQQPGTALDDGDLDAECGEDRGVLRSNRAGPQNHQLRRQPVDPEQSLGVVDIGVSERNARRVVRMRTGRQQDRTGAKGPLAALLVANDHCPVGTEPRITAHQLDVVALQVLLTAPDISATTCLTRARRRFIITSGARPIPTP
jgi:hypothetical protein